ncbi:hypothetical protein MLD38_017629 [Melastoma candidum]|uniref:Uncharacterized protein n=1 Tax=Melastoma candidum TaxID=119954 RepID=A0ACB9QT52_9MYRT|nr:hypothetical protein MLD38_017629 [Melastoma candidum]
MDSELKLRPGEPDKCRNCGCSCCSDMASPMSWLRSVKRKYEEFTDSERLSNLGLDVMSVARVQVENEMLALREMVASQQQIIEEMSIELDEERNASSTAANEAMSMILRLQREKAEIQMEANQFRRFAEEKMGHDQHEMKALEDLLFRREQTIHSLTCEVQAYKHRMMSYGLSEAEADGERSRGPSRNASFAENELEYALYDYPPLKCNLNETDGPLDGEFDDADIDKYACGETPREELQDLEHRIFEMERNASMNHVDGDLLGSRNVLEKNVAVLSPPRRCHSRMLSNDSSSSLIGGRRNDNLRPVASFKKTQYFPQAADSSSLRVRNNASDPGDDYGDRVCTIDSVDNGTKGMKPVSGNFKDYVSTPRESIYQGEDGNPDIKKLYTRLQALEADRESMRQAIISMRTDKAQLILLKEIAQQLCKDVPSERHAAGKKITPFGSFSFMSIFKWIASVVFWRKKALRNRNLFGISPNKLGLLLLLDKGSRTRQLKCLTRIPA